MSESDNQSLATLLPSASVMLFSEDDTTHTAFNSLAQDWRFSRVKSQGHNMSLLAAIEALAEQASPDLVIVQTDTIGEGFAQTLENLAAHCDEGTAAIVIGPDNDVYLYRRLIEMGVSDYLVRPVDPSVLADVIAKVLIEKLGVSDSRLIVFCGAKGGVGATSLAQAGACAVADFLNEKVVLIDGSGGHTAMPVAFGFEPQAHMEEAARAAMNGDEASLMRTLHKVSDNLSVLTGSDLILGESITPESYERIIDMLMVKYPVVMVDLSEAPAALYRSLVPRANQVVLVSTPVLPALRLARELFQEVKELRGGHTANVEMIINMQGHDSAHEVAKKDIEEAMDIAVSSVIPYAPKVFPELENQGRKVTENTEGQKIIVGALLPVLQKILGGETTQEQDGKASGLLNDILGAFKVK